VAAITPAHARSNVVDLVPFVHVSDVARSIRFWEALGFRVVKRYEPNGRLEFAGLESTAAAKVMLARVDRPSERDPDQPALGFLYRSRPPTAVNRRRAVKGTA
jgi:catechol 2,3-dioxygenase-like lactoylglutathione lyase family enzyme